MLLLTAQECDEMHDEPQRKLEEAARKEREEQRRKYELILPQLIDEYIEYLAVYQRKERLPIYVDKSPPDKGAETINERLKPYGLYLASYYQDNSYPNDPIRYVLTKK